MASPSEDPFRAITTGTDKRPVSHWSVHLQREGGGLLSDHSSQAATTGAERPPNSPWPVNPQQKGFGLPSVTTPP